MIGLHSLGYGQKGQARTLESLYMEAVTTVHRAGQMRLQETSSSIFSSRGGTSSSKGKFMQTASKTALMWWMTDLILLLRFHGDNIQQSSLVQTVQRGLFDLS